LIDNTSNGDVALDASGKMGGLLRVDLNGVNLEWD
jgi:hypothetical protein